MSLNCTMRALSSAGGRTTCEFMPCWNMRRQQEGGSDDLLGEG